MPIFRPVMVLVAAILIFVLTIYAVDYPGQMDWRLRIVAATTILGLLLVLGTELLSVLSAIDFAGLLVFWSLVVAALVGLIAYRWRSNPAARRFPDFAPQVKDVLSTPHLLLPSVLS